MMIVVTGRVKIVSVSRTGSDVILNMIQSGEVLGEISLLDGRSRSADAVTTRATQLVTLHRRDVLPRLYESPDALSALIGVLCDRVRQASAFIEDTVFLDAESRLLARLRSLASQYGRVDPASREIRIEHGLSQQELGDSVGLTRVSVNRQLAAWRERGLILDGRGYIVVRDMDALEASVRKDPERS